MSNRDQAEAGLDRDQRFAAAWGLAGGAPFAIFFAVAGSPVFALITLVACPLATLAVYEGIMRGYL